MKSSSLGILAASMILSSPAATQTRSTRDTATAYGARLNAKGQPANQNQNRVNSRINSRIDNRLSLRIERYRPDNTNNPAAAFQTVQDDKSRIAPVVAPPPPQDDDTP